MAKIDLNDYLEKLTEPEDRETVANRAYQRELFEQYVTKDGNFPEQRAQLLEDFRAGKELTGPKGLRRKLGAFDLEYFGRAYLAHYFVRPSPKFHGELDRIWREGVLKGMNPEVDAKRISRADGCRRAIEAPRGHAKSTTFTFKDDLHAAVYGYKHYIIILSDSSEQAEGFLVDIKTELEENAALKEDFGELEGKVWKSSVILLANGVKIEAIGSGKKIRGRRHKQWRPDLIVCDDLENDENVNTPEQRKKLRDWFYKAVSKAGDTYTDIVYIGTLLHFDALLANVAKNPSYKSVRYQGVISFATNGELWDAWESIFTDLSNDNRQEDALEFFQANREAMLEGTAVLWEEKLSYYDLMVIRISEGEASFNSEIQNDPIDPENCTFQEEWFDFWDDEGKAQPDFSDPKFLFVGANDPSLGKNKKSDTSSIIALAKDTQTGYLYVVIADIAKRKPDQIIEDALDASRRLQREYKRPYYKFGVETVQFQYYFAEIMRQRAAAVGEYLPMYGKGPIRAAFNVQHDMRVARMKWGDEATVIKIDVRKFFYSIDRSVLKQIIAKRFKKLKKKYPEKYEDFLRFYRLLCKVIDSSPEGERGIPLGNVSSQDFANIYLNELDQFCIRFLGATLYTRYMDDVVIIAARITPSGIGRVSILGVKRRIPRIRRTVRSVGIGSARYWFDNYAASSDSLVGFRPVLEILNTDPLISDSDRDLGDKNSNFTITYTVDDADSGDVLTATESLDGQTTKSFAPTRNLVNTISVDVDSLSLGKHTVKVVVSDGQGGTATRTWTFTRTNSAPTISGSDGNLGDKNLGFTYAYTIDDADGDTLTVVEELNDETIRTINNAPKGEELTVTITSEKLYALGLNSVNTLKITVTDGKGGTAYRRVTFKRTNSAPTISGQDKALGLKNGSFAENYTVSDVEGDNVVVTEFVDDVQIRSYQATLGQQETIELTREKWLSLTNGQHQLRIEAVDGNFATSVRVFSFSKKETVIKFELAAPEETDAAATKVLVTPTWKIEGAVAKVEACNNGFDAVPTWEDITAMVQINRVYNFTNKTKTASKWGVNIRFTITKNEGFEGEVSISGFGGAYE